MRLDERIPETGLGRGVEPLDLFLAWVADRGITLYPHQEEAILEVFAGNHVLLDAPTGSGKSLVATAMHFSTFAALGRAWYTAPIKALVSEKFFELCAIFGPEHVGCLTGDGAVNRDAPIVCCTAEILANLALREGPDARVDSVVMDEFHYYGDRARGMAWQVPLLRLPRARFLLLSGTLGDTTAIQADLARRTARPVREVRGVHRPVPLQFRYSLDPLQDTLAQLVRTGKGPVYVVHFAQSAATERAQALMSVDWCTKEEKRALAVAIQGFGFHSPFGPTLRRYLLHGIGLHHAGLLPRYRLLVERLAQQGLLKIICGTDTLGVGINVPIRSVLFTQLCKFDGEDVVLLPVREFQQIAGRAGRAGFDIAGDVVVQAPEHVILNKIREANQKKKAVKAQPPSRGYKPWDEGTFQRLVDGRCEALEPRLEVDHGVLLTLVQREGDARRGRDAAQALIADSHLPPPQQAARIAQLDRQLLDLVRAGVVDEDGRVAAGLQRDFSLEQSLSLYLVEVLATLDPASPTYALDVVSHTESILEHPRVILAKQEARAKRDQLAAWKAAGIPFEERIALLEDVTYPKPLANEIYALFNAYRAAHPWVQAEAVRPKSIAREMLETWASFADAIGALELPRAEGVLLRYLSQVYETLVKTVPATARTDALEEVIQYLRATLAAVDASVVEAWERLFASPTAEGPPRPIDISADKKRFLARIRAELHGLVRALVVGDWDTASASVRRGEDDPWGPEAWAAAVADLRAQVGAIAFDHRSRLAQHTRVRPIGPHRWEVAQDLIAVDDEDGTPCASVVGEVDLSDDTNPVGPLVRVVAIQ
jgi:hypothetical protein